MCVSAEASFALAGLLVPTGIYCVKVARQRDPAALPLAVVPILFGVQQFAEGLVWLGIRHDRLGLTHWAAVAYLFFAIMFWLFWIPFSAVFLESRRTIKLLLGLGSLLGLAGGVAFYLPILLNPGDLVVTVNHHSIQYEFAHFPALERISPLGGHLAYLIVVSLPFFLVAQKRRGLVLLSIGLTVSAMISHVFFWYTFTSVWCFFAALLTVLLGYTFHTLPVPAGRPALQQ